MSPTYPALRHFVAILCVACFSGCAGPDATAGHTGTDSRTGKTGQGDRDLCLLPHSQKMESITLAFGLTTPDGRQITTEAWNDFLARTVTPRFPAGLSVIEAQGQWQETPAQPVTHEPSRLVWIMAPDSPSLVPALDAIREAYKKRFNQKSVAAFMRSGCASF